MINDEQLIVVGTGIRAVGQLTTETIAWMRAADKVLYVVADPVAERAIQELNPEGAESLMPLYGEGKPRNETYLQIIETTMSYLRQGLRVCAAVYGHPGIFAVSMHEIIRRAKGEGFKARMLPAISALDCLFADLGVDPVGGCATYEATDFLLTERSVDPSAHLILWQIGGLGDPTYKSYDYEIRGLPQLTRKLMAYFGPHHTVFLYEAPMFPGVEPLIAPGPLMQLPQGNPPPNSTLYVPPAGPARPDLAARSELGAGGW